MAIAPASGGISPTQQAVLEQIRALRAVKPPGAVTAPVAAPVQARPAGNPIATLMQSTGAPPAARPRGSIINITV